MAKEDESRDPNVLSASINNFYRDTRKRQNMNVCGKNSCTREIRGRMSERRVLIIENWTKIFLT